MDRSVPRLLAGMLLMMATCINVLAPDAAHAATTWQVKIGGESPGKALQAQAFLPSTMTVNVGDTINWTLNSFLHTVSFLSGGPRPPDAVPEGDRFLFNPAVVFPAGGATYDGTGYVSSGVLDRPGASYALEFTQAGTYGYVCVLHPGMDGTIVVQPAGSSYPMTQAQVDAKASEELSSKLAIAQAAQDRAQLTSRPGASGTTNYTVLNGVGGGQASVLRYLPDQVTVRAGDTVTWVVKDPHEIHTVTFYDPAGDVPIFTEVVPQPNGPPKIYLQNVAPAGGTTVTRPGLYNSGINGPEQSTTFTFPTPGVYSYVCVIHAGQGMFGMVTVQAAMPLPNTGVDDGQVTFPQTGYSLEGDFLSYWNMQGGLEAFGYPVDSAREVDGQVVQWLERARFELHPENVAPYRVQLGRIGVEALERQGRAWEAFARASPSAAHYFAETGHAIDFAPFWSYWASHGLEFDRRPGTSVAESLALFGLPVSEAQMERNADGDTVLTQWFERARLEYHPRNPAAYRVLLGRAGAELRAVKKQ